MSASTPPARRRRIPPPDSGSGSVGHDGIDRLGNPSQRVTNWLEGVRSQLRVLRAKVHQHLAVLGDDERHYAELIKRTGPGHMVPIAREIQVQNILDASNELPRSTQTTLPKHSTEMQDVRNCKSKAPVECKGKKRARVHPGTASDVVERSPKRKASSRRQLIDESSRDNESYLYGGMLIYSPLYRCMLEQRGTPLLDELHQKRKNVQTRLRELQSKSGKRLATAGEPPRNKTHWDFLLEEMEWMVNDFRGEDKWKVMLARKTVRQCAKQVEKNRSEDARRARRATAHRRRLAASTSREIARFWTKIAKLSSYEWKAGKEAEQRHSRSKQLEQLVDKSEEMSTKVAEKLRNRLVTSTARKGIHSTSLDVPIVSISDNSEAIHAVIVDNNANEHQGSGSRAFEESSEEAVHDQDKILRSDELEHDALESPVDSDLRRLPTDEEYCVDVSMDDDDLSSDESDEECDDSTTRANADIALADRSQLAAVLSVHGSGHKQTAEPRMLRYGKLRDYQRVGLDWLLAMYDQNLNGVLADEMGLGKTVMTIALLAVLADERSVWGPHLIVVPTSVLLNWEVEFKRWLPGLKTVAYHGSARERRAKRKGWSRSDTFHVCIVSYKTFMADQRIFKRRLWHYLVLDEAQYIKNFRSQRWQALVSLKSMHRLLLTGTPLQNSLTELWSLMHFLMPRMFASQKEFQDWFSDPVNQRLERGGSEDIVHRLHTVLRPFLLRRMKKDVAKQLPGKFEHIVPCRLSRRQRRLYEDVLSSGDSARAIESGNYVGLVNTLMQLRKVCNHPDLFAGRQVESPFVMERLKFHTSKRFVLETGPRLFLEFWADMNFSKWDVELFQAISSANDIVVERQRNFEADIVEISTVYFPRPKSETAGSSPNPRTSVFFSSWQFKLDKDRADAHLKSETLAARNSRRCKNFVTHPLGMDLVSILSSNYEEERIVSSSIFGPSIARLQPFLLTVSRVLGSGIQFSCSSPNLSSTFDKLKSSSFSSSSPLACASESADSFLWAAYQRSAIGLPDKQLVQFDCGKLQALAVLLQRLKRGGHRVLIFTQMTRMLDVLEAFLNLYGYTYLRLDGSTSVEQRQRRMERFNSNDKIFAFVLSTRSGGLGINLTGADTVVFYDTDWNPQIDLQAQDRAHRLGQTREVHIYRLVCTDTVEENILLKAQQKRALSQLVIGDGHFDTHVMLQSASSLASIIGSSEVTCSALPAAASKAVDSTSLRQALSFAEDESDRAAAHVVLAEEAMNAPAAEFADEATAFDVEARAFRRTLAASLRPVEAWALEWYTVAVHQAYADEQAEFTVIESVMKEAESDHQERQAAAITPTSHVERKQFLPLKSSVSKSKTGGFIPGPRLFYVNAGNSWPVRQAFNPQGQLSLHTAPATLDAAYRIGRVLNLNLTGLKRSHHPIDDLPSMAHFSPSPPSSEDIMLIFNKDTHELRPSSSAPQNIFSSVIKSRLAIDTSLADTTFWAHLSSVPAYERLFRDLISEDVEINATMAVKTLDGSRSMLSEAICSKTSIATASVTKKSKARAMEIGVAPLSERHPIIVRIPRVRIPSYTRVPVHLREALIAAARNKRRFKRRLDQEQAASALVRVMHSTLQQRRSLVPYDLGAIQGSVLLQGRKKLKLPRSVIRVATQHQEESPQHQHAQLVRHPRSATLATLSSVHATGQRSRTSRYRSDSRIGVMPLLNISVVDLKERADKCVPREFTASLSASLQASGSLLDWISDEDALLLATVATFGTESWRLVAVTLERDVKLEGHLRSAEQCADRYSLLRLRQRERRQIDDRKELEERLTRVKEATDPSVAVVPNSLSSTCGGSSNELMPKVSPEEERLRRVGSVLYPQPQPPPPPADSWGEPSTRRGGIEWQRARSTAFNNGYALHAFAQMFKATHALASQQRTCKKAFRAPLVREAASSSVESTTPTTSIGAAQIVAPKLKEPLKRVHVSHQNAIERGHRRLHVPASSLGQMFSPRQLVERRYARDREQAQMRQQFSQQARALTPTAATAAVVMSRRPGVEAAAAAAVAAERGVSSNSSAALQQQQQKELQFLRMLIAQQPHLQQSMLEGLQRTAHNRAERVKFINHMYAQAQAHHHRLQQHQFQQQQLQQQQAPSHQLHHTPSHHSNQQQN